MNYNLRVFAGRCIATHWLPLRNFRRFFSESYYDVLKVSPTCSAKEIREAFLLLSKKTHPDKHLNDPSMHEKFVRLNEAYSTLSNPSSRRAYDLTLYNERKLNPPYGKSYSQRRANSYQSTKSSHSTNTGYYKDPFSWENKNNTNYGQHFSFGLHGVKRISNTVIVLMLLSFTVFGAIIQLLAIRHSFLLNQEKMLEKSHHYSLIHKLAREHAKLKGNAHQIEILKKNLAGSYNDVEQINNNESDRKINEGITPGSLVNNEDKGKNQTQNVKGIKAGGCAIHGTSSQCAIHNKKSDDVIVNKKCNKCGQKID